MLEPPRSSLSSQVTVTAAGEVFAADTPGNRELARRITACVNACAGFSTDDLEQGLLERMREVIEQLSPLAAANEAARAAARAA